MSGPIDELHTSAQISQEEMIAVRRRLQSQFAAVPLAFSTDGKTFGYEAPLDYPIPAGSYVQIRAVDDEIYIGQVIAKSIKTREGPELALDVDRRFDIALEGAHVAQATVRPRIRYVEGHGVLLGKAAASVLEPLRSTDLFQDAELAPAPSELVNLYLQTGVTDAGGLDVGWATYGDEKTIVPLRARGFGRHTFLCGQSGSGKTYSLGVVLERMLMRSRLRLLIIDPNSDFVRLSQVRNDASGAFASEELEQFEALRDSIRVVRPEPGDDESRLAIRFGDLARREQALVLQLDPLENREEYSSFWRIVDFLGGDSVELSDVLQAAMRDTAAESREISLRVRNLGISDWSIWSRQGEPSCSGQLDESWRAMVLDIGALGLAAEKQVVTLAMLSQLWRRREERKAILTVIDEAHNICPAEPETALQALLTQYVIGIAAEGRKFGLYLLLASQRPQKIHPNVLSQCDNLILMRMNSSADLAYLSDVFSFVPDDLLQEASHFRQGESLVAGPIVPTPTFVRFGRRLTQEGGRDVPATWARPAERD